MLYKKTPFTPHSDYGDKTRIIDFSDTGLNKLASAETYIPEKLASAIADIKDSPDPNYAYLYDRAMGAGEVYGPNNNGDWFGRDELMRKHATFVSDAHLFRHHQNKDPRNKIGDVMVSDYNDKLDTVDLIIKAPLEKVAKDLQKLEKGNVLATSMGARVKHDQCSICGNKASRRLAYCRHLRSQMLKVYPDGRQVFAINPNPRFVDISIVVIPADPSSAVLKKIASESTPYKYAAMDKRDAGFGGDNNGVFEGEARGAIRPEVIEATNSFDRADVIKTLDHIHGPLRPDEFQAILQKDASLINPDIIPYVSYENTKKMNLSGNVIKDLVPHMQKVANVQIKNDAELRHYNFSNHHEKLAYMTYRNSLQFSKTFIR